MVGCRCLSSEKKYGAPVVCEQCKLKCAFERPQNQKEKVCVCVVVVVCAQCLQLIAILLQSVCTPIVWVCLFEHVYLSSPLVIFCLYVFRKWKSLMCVNVTCPLIYIPVSSCMCACMCPLACVLLHLKLYPSSNDRLMARPCASCAQ